MYLRRKQKGAGAKLLLVSAIALIGCGSDGAPSLRTAASAQWSSGFEDTLVHHAFRVDEVVYSCQSDVAGLTYIDETGETVSIALPGVFPQHLITPGSAGAASEIWVVAGNGSGDMSLRAYTDQTGDGVVDSASEQTLFSSSRPDVTRSAAIHVESGTVYLLECGTGNIYRARDTNGDQRPDVLDAVPFVHGAWIPGHPDLYFIDSVDPDTGVTIQNPAGVTAVARKIREATETSVLIDLVGVATDSDADGVADDLKHHLDGQSVAPSALAGKLVAGSVNVPVQGAWGSSLELREVDEQGAVLATIATTTLTRSSGVLQASVGLDESDLYVIHDVTLGLDSFTYTVLPAELIVEAPDDPVSFTEGETSTIVLPGANLDLIDQVQLVSSELNGPAQISLTYTVAPNGRSIEVAVPALNSSWVGMALLNFVDDGPPQEFSIVCDVCAADEGSSG